jgi:hypothetical protein
MLAAVVALSGSAASAAAAVLRVPVALRAAVVPLAVPREPEVPVRVRALAVLAQAPPRLRLLLLAELRRDRLLNLSASPLPPVVAESEAPVRLQVRRWFSAATARSSPPTGKPS